MAQGAEFGISTRGPTRTCNSRAHICTTPRRFSPTRWRPIPWLAHGQAAVACAPGTREIFWPLYTQTQVRCEPCRNPRRLPAGMRTLPSCRCPLTRAAGYPPFRPRRLSTRIKRYMTGLCRPGTTCSTSTTETFWVTRHSAPPSAPVWANRLRRDQSSQESPSPNRSGLMQEIVIAAVPGSWRASILHTATWMN